MQQWTIEEISIFSNNSHLEWRAGLSETILKGTYPRNIPVRFGLIWFSGFQRRRFKCEKSTNQKQELPVAAMFFDGSHLN
jgi:hypothetical protein